jgi:thiol-disulfide isomerase/thioredoxin
VEHAPQPGDAALVGGVRFVVRVANGTAIADGNPPLAGQALRFEATLREVFPPAGSADHPIAPDAVLVAVDGRRFNLSDLRGQPVLLDFFATWCVTCLQQAPALARAHAEFPNATFVSVTVDPLDGAAQIAQFRAEAAREGAPMNWTFAFDPTGQAARGFGVAALPRSVVLDADGRIRAASQGLRSWEELRSDLALAG